MTARTVKEDGAIAAGAAGSQLLETTSLRAARVAYRATIGFMCAVIARNRYLSSSAGILGIISIICGVSWDWKMVLHHR